MLSINFLGLDGLLIGTMISFIVNILLKTNLISKKILKDIKLFSILKYFVVTVILYIFLAVVSMPVENYFLSVSNGFVRTILMLGLVFILVTGITSGVLYFVSNDARGLFKRGIGLIRRKLKK